MAKTYEQVGSGYGDVENLRIKTETSEGQKLRRFG